MDKHLLVMCFCVLAAGILRAQVYTAGPQVLTFFSDVDDSDQPYALYLPKDFEPARKYPLVISLHGAWSNHRLNLKRVFGKGNKPGESDAEASRYFPPFKDVDYIVASPYARGTMGYQGIPERDVYAVLEDVRRRFPIDPDRIYLTGLSMGGGGTLWLGLTRPDLWAAIAPVCPAPPEGAESLAPNALNLPVHLFHGDQDPAVHVDVSRRWQKLLLNLDSNVEYVEYPGVKHNSWDYAYTGAAIFDWFDKFRHDPFPQRVRFVTEAYKYRSAYWVEVDGLTPGTLASIDARFAEKNRIEVKASNLDGFTLRLAGHPSFTSTHPLEVSVNGVTYKIRAAESASFTKNGDSWTAGRYAPPVGAKRPGLEGPISEAVASRHIYVYGTSAAAGPEEINRRREQAMRAAEWSAPHLKLLLTLHALTDEEITEADITGGNLVLFGTRETNKVIARFSGQFPLELNAGAADYGLVFVYPAGNRYVVVNSGLPFWTGAESAHRPGLDADDPAYRVLMTLPDCILFKGSLANVVAEGRFDRNWKIPAPVAEKLRATGAVEVR